MFLSVATTHHPATDLGFILHKHPDRVHETELSFGKAYVFYPEATAARCEAALVLDVDPVGLVRGRGRADGLQDQYVNDRPYAASSLLSVAMSRSLRTAMTGSSKHRPDLASADMPLEAHVTPLPVRGADDLVRRLFEPLGWAVDVAPIMGTGGPSRSVSLRLKGMARLSALLTHLYVLIPVLDDEKHYWVGDDEVAKLLQKGEGWLDRHPARALIVNRYLKHRRDLTRDALARLVPDAVETESVLGLARAVAEDEIEAPIRLHDQRLDAVVEALRVAGATTVADLGCGEGKLLARLVKERTITAMLGVDASARELERAARRLKMGEPGGPPEGRVTLLHGALTYRDRRWHRADAAALVEVVEHLDLDRIPALERVVFGDAKPRTVVVTTPNADYNALFPSLTAGTFRHPDHRFEWTRAQFRAWAMSIEDRYGYTAALTDIGPVDAERGAPTQMAVFSR